MIVIPQSELFSTRSQRTLIPVGCFHVAADGSLLGNSCAELTVVMKSFTWCHTVESTGNKRDG